MPWAASAPARNPRRYGRSDIAHTKTRAARSADRLRAVRGAAGAPRRFPYGSRGSGIPGTALILRGISCSLPGRSGSDERAPGAREKPGLLHAARSKKTGAALQGSLASASDRARTGAVGLSRAYESGEGQLAGELAETSFVLQIVISRFAVNSTTANDTKRGKASLALERAAGRTTSRQSCEPSAFPQRFAAAGGWGYRRRLE